MHYRYPGQEIAARAIEPLVTYLQNAGITSHQLPSKHHLLQPGLRISWHQFLGILNVAQAHCSDQQLEAIGALGLQSPHYRRRLGFARWLLTLEDAYRFMVYPHKVVDYGCTQAAVATEPGSVWITALLREGYEPSDTFFRIMLGAAKKLPEMFGIDNAQVTGEMSGRSMRYCIRYHAKQTVKARAHRWLSHRIRMLYCAFNMSSAYEELVDRTFALESSLAERERISNELLLDRAEHTRRMEHVAEVIAEYDYLNRVVYLSPNAERVFGYSNQALLENPLMILRSQERRAAETFFGDPSLIPNGVYPISAVHADGHDMQLEIAISHFTGADGKPRWIATLRDVSLRQRPTVSESQVHAPKLPELVVVEKFPVAAPQSDAKKLLLADDDPRTQKIGRKILERAGYEVVCVGDGSDALQRLAQHSYAGLLLDVDMPNKSGIEVYDQLRTEGAVLPTVFVSGSTAPIIDRFPEATVVRKPFKADQLVAAIRQVVAA